MSAYFPNRWLPYLLVLPSVVLVVVFFILPAVQSLELSLYLASRTSDVRVFKGIENFVDLFQDDQYIDSLLTTAAFVLIVVPSALTISLLLALGALPIEMLLGVREADARDLVDRGVPVRCYVPYGLDWFRYWLRRLAESQGTG